ncbi:MAG: ScyD/ScyE family protein [Actinobacteria bacterium]|nr:ScyD/ScyE family protein [Actinomycetota bacterium]
MRPHRAVVVCAAWLAATTALFVQSGPVAYATSGVTVVAAGLDNPRGLAFDPHGNLYIAEAGHGGSLPLGTGPEGGALFGGLSGGISKVLSADVVTGGHATRVVSGFVSLAGEDGTAAEGMAAVSTQGNRLYAQMGVNSAELGSVPGLPQAFHDAAVAQLGTTLKISGSSWTRLAGTGNADFAWTEAHQSLGMGQFPDANPNGIETMGNTQYVADAGANIIAKVDALGHVSTLAFLPVPAGAVTDAVPTCVAKAPDGSLYVGELLGGFYQPGMARVWRIADGVATVKWSGFTTIQGCGFDPVGNFYVTELKLSGLGPDPSPVGAVVRIAPNGTRTTYGMGQLFLPSGFAFHDGAVYVSNWSIMPAHNAGPTGQVVRIPVS